MSFKFTDNQLIQIKEILAKYPTKQAALMPVLWLVQNNKGYISLKAQEEIASLLNLSPVHVYGVVSFYTEFKTKPKGKYHLQLCRTLSCALNKAEDLERYLKEEHGLVDGGVTKDGLLSLELVECLASCGTGPVMKVNGSLLEKVTIEVLKKVLSGLKSR